MKKNTEWLKKEIGELPRADTIFDNYGSSYMDSAVPITDVYELIDQLDEPEVLSQEFIDKHTWDNHNVGRPFVYVDDLQNLLVPKQEKVKVPRFMADYLLLAKQDIELGGVIDYSVTDDELVSQDKEDDWARELIGTFIRSWLVDSFKVEEESSQSYPHDDMIEKEIVLVTKQDLPVIPKFAAEWIEELKPYKSLRVAFEYIARRKRNYHDDELAFWIEEGNSETFARAWLDGYTVEEEPLYRARLKIITSEFVPTYLRTRSSDDKERLKTLEIGNKYILKKYRHLSEFTEEELKRLYIWDSDQWEIEEVEE